MPTPGTHPRSDDWSRGSGVAEHATVVIGGAGVVGGHVARLLARDGRRVLVSSRRLTTAAAAARSIEGAEPVVVDTEDPRWSLPDDVGLVIDCTGSGRLEVAQAAVAAGADLIDTTASSDHIASLEGLDQAFAGSGCRLLSSVGLAPGLSSVLAHTVHRSEHPEPIVVQGVLDARDEYGPGSAAFTLGKVGTEFVDPATGERVRNYSGLTRPRLPAGFGRCLLGRVDFPDQYTLGADLGVPVTTRYGFTNEITTAALAVFTCVRGAGRVLERVTSLIPEPTGTGPWLITAETARRRVWATGTGQAYGTAVITRLAARLLAGDGITPGHHRLYRHLDLDPATIADLAEQGIAIAFDHHQLDPTRTISGRRIHASPSAAERDNTQ